MTIKYDNSMYCTNPPVVIEEEDDVPNPNNEMEHQIMMKKDEDYYYFDFVDLEELRIRELIKWEGLKNNPIIS